MSKELSFEEKLNKLEEIVSELEQGNIDLDDATKAVNKILNADGKLEDFKELEKEEE